MVFPRGQSCNAGLAHLYTEASMTPGVWRDSRFQPVLKGPHVKQAQLNCRRRWGHEVQHPLKRFEGARDWEFEWSHELLNSQCTFWRDRSPHSGVDNCSQELNFLDGGQRALGKNWPLGTLSGWGSWICDIEARPQTGVIQDADSQLSQRRKSRIHALHKSAGS